MKSIEKCSTRWCRNKKPKKGRICPKCRKKLDKQRHPCAYAFNTLKSNAKRRGKPFDLTLDQFKEFCTETGYMEGKGKTADSMTIDRKDHTKGYTYENIHVLSLSANAVKHYEDLKKDVPF